MQIQNIKISIQRPVCTSIKDSVLFQHVCVCKDLITGSSIAIEPGGTRDHSPPRQPLSPEWSTLRRKTEDSVSKHFICFFNMETVLTFVWDLSHTFALSHVD